ASRNGSLTKNPYARSAAAPVHLPLFTPVKSAFAHSVRSKRGAMISAFSDERRRIVRIAGDDESIPGATQSTTTLASRTGIGAAVQGSKAPLLEDKVSCRCTARSLL